MEGTSASNVEGDAGSYIPNLLVVEAELFVVGSTQSSKSEGSWSLEARSSVRVTVWLEADRAVEENPCTTQRGNCFRLNQKTDAQRIPPLRGDDAERIVEM